MEIQEIQGDSEIQERYSQGRWRYSEIQEKYRRDTGEIVRYRRDTARGDRDTVRYRGDGEIQQRYSAEAGRKKCNHKNLWLISCDVYYINIFVA